MSNAVYPVLPGLDLQVRWMPKFANLIQEAASGAEVRVGLRLYPIHEFTLKYEFLRSSASYPELQNLLGFFMQRQGGLDSFLFSNPYDNQATAQGIAALNATGLPDGSTTQFQLTRSYGGMVEPVMNPNAVTAVYVNGGSVSYTLGANGVVTLAAPPSGGQVVTWTGTFYYRCRFLEDSLEFEQFMNFLWSAGKVRFHGSLGAKIP